MQRFALDFRWLGFELHPEIPPGGVDIDRVLPPARVEAMNARLAEVARGFGVPFAPRRHAPNTQPALAISDLARREGKLDAWREAAMDAYWRDGRDIEDRDVLRELAAAAGLDPDAAVGAVAGSGPVIQAQRAEAARWGVSSIPTWFFLPAGWEPGDPRPEDGPRPVGVVGCQPAEVLDRAARAAGAEERAGGA